ncbi:MAG: helix-turn-helix domain-containing protein [Clostridia bacterium]|nr:helix-turn-helix domain-containing protein [Clostridia bacterium]
MKDKLIYDINQYIAHLNDNGLFVTVHGKTLGGLLEHNIHRNPFCTLVKTNAEAWEKCIRCQQKLFGNHKKEFLFGMCHAGVEEYVFFVDDKTFICVSGYGISKEKAAERIKGLSREFYLSETELLRVYNSGLKHKPENTEELAAIIKPLCHMLYLLQLLLADVPENETKSALFDSLLAFVQYNFMSDISIKDIACACSCSESTVCHLFKQYTDLSVKKYITRLRITQAKKLLGSSDIPISTVAQMCGFFNINYFPTAFKKQTGITPTEYREHCQTP